MKPEIKEEELTLAQLNLMALRYGRQNVEASVDRVLEYSDVHASSGFDVLVGTQFITIVPRGTSLEEVPLKAVFSIHVPSAMVFIDEAGHFGTPRTAHQAYKEFEELQSKSGSKFLQ